MARALVTGTRRGLVLTLYSEVLLVVGAAAFVLFPRFPAILVWAVLGSALLGAPAGLSFWGGRHEFGPAAARGVKRATIAFFVLFLCLVLAFYEVTTVFPESLKLVDLWPPWFFLALALVADAAAIHFLLTPLVPRPTWVRVAMGMAVLGLAAHLWFGTNAIQEFVARSGGVAQNPAEAGSYVRDFNLRVTRVWAAALLALRVGFGPALLQALSSVAEAEREAEEAGTHASLTGPPG